ncbi:hypothetical protein O3P69_005769 [Scylla paramamosain]|uniref:Uncharacterized protein n=1 Tax=Scylla paramamosain TaxID=85552 RepID=A0AAW0U8N1_SCYPA
MPRKGPSAGNKRRILIRKSKGGEEEAKQGIHQLSPRCPKQKVSIGVSLILVLAMLWASTHFINLLSAVPLPLPRHARAAHDPLPTPTYPPMGGHGRGATVTQLATTTITALSTCFTAATNAPVCLGRRRRLAVKTRLNM